MGLFDFLKQNTNSKSFFDLSKDPLDEAVKVPELMQVVHDTFNIVFQLSLAETKMRLLDDYAKLAKSLNVDSNTMRIEDDKDSLGMYLNKDSVTQEQAAQITEELTKTVDEVMADWKSFVVKFQLTVKSHNQYNAEHHYEYEVGFFAVLKDHLRNLEMSRKMAKSKAAADGIASEIQELQDKINEKLESNNPEDFEQAAELVKQKEELFKKIKDLAKEDLSSDMYAETAEKLDNEITKCNQQCEAIGRRAEQAKKNKIEDLESLDTSKERDYEELNKEYEQQRPSSYEDPKAIDFIEIDNQDVLDLLS